MANTTSLKLSIAIIGTGLIGPRHAQSVLSNPHAKLHSITDPSPHAVQLASSHNTQYFSSITELLSSNPLPEAAIVCTPNNTHVALSLQLINAGIPVLVEKPISTSIEDGKRLINATKEKGVPLLVGHHRRFNPYLLSAKRCLDEKKLGRVIAVQGTWSLKKPLPYFSGIGEWRKGSDGGTILINLIHEIDLLQYLLGPIVLISALETSKTRGFEAEEGAAILLRFESGVVGTFVLSDACPSPWNFEAGTGENPMIPHVAASSGAGGFYRILGTEASLSVPDLTVWRNESWEEVLGVEDLGVEREKVPFDVQVQHFWEVVREGRSPNCGGEDALRAMVVCEGVRRSMKTGKAVEIRGFEILESI